MDMASILNIFHSLNNDVRENRKVVHESIDDTCIHCNGTGRKTCSWCSGTGIQLDESLEYPCNHCENGYVTCVHCEDAEPSIVHEGFFHNSKIDSLLHQFGYNDYVKTNGDYSCQFMKDNKGNYFMLRITKNGEPFQKINGDMSELKTALHEAENIMSKITEGASKVCPTCNADGEIECQTCHGTKDDCKTCHGEGSICCAKCKGQGYLGKLKENFDNSAVVTQTPSEDDYKNNINVTTNYDKASGNKAITITAQNDGADDLMDILKLSGIFPSHSHDNILDAEIHTMVVDDELEKSDLNNVIDNYNDDFSIDEMEYTPMNNEKEWTIDDYKIDEDELTESYNSRYEESNDDYEDSYTSNKPKFCSTCECLHQGKCPAESMFKDDDTCIECGEDLNTESLEMGRNKCQNCCLTDSDFEHDRMLRNAGLDEALTPKRTKEGLNDAQNTWHNTPNEQIAGYLALIQDADGPNKPKGQYKNSYRNGDNPMTMAANQKDERLHESKKLAEELMNKFKSFKGKK